jgi:short-chain Z-isoprenyl diphosphate synthase
VGLRDLAYGVYERRLSHALVGTPRPRHVGVILDGNRRWAKAAGAKHVSHGHQAGADHIEDLLGWCDDADVEVVTLWLLSSDNLTRSSDELVPLLAIIEDTVRDLAAPAKPWRVHPVGALDLLPDTTVRVLKEAAEVTRDKPGLVVNVAVGYGGRREIADAVRGLLHEHAEKGASLEEVASLLDVGPTRCDTGGSAADLSRGSRADNSRDLRRVQGVRSRCLHVATRRAHRLRVGVVRRVATAYLLSGYGVR